MTTLTNAQTNRLRTAAFLVPEAAALIAAGNVAGLITWCNTASGQLRWLPSPDMVGVEEAPSYTTYDTLTQGKRDSWLLLLRNVRDFGRAKVRSWVVDVWGPATAGSNTEAVLLAATAPATNAQVAIGGTVRATGTVSAIDTPYEQDVDEDDAKRLIFRDNGNIWVPAA